MNETNESQTFATGIYIRLSQEDGDREESNSVANQKALLTEYIENFDDLFLYDVYVDDGYSGLNFNRPAFQRMLNDIYSGVITCVVVKDLSRFGRDYIEVGRYIERLFPAMGVRFISYSDRLDSAKQSYDILLPIKNIFNEQYARDISAKITTVIRSKQKSGEYVGAFACYGYKKSPTDKNKLIVDEYAAKVVRRIFSLYLNGVGKQRIANILNDDEIPCPTEYKRLNGENYKNCNRLKTTRYWTYSTIHTILSNEMYCGTMVQGKKKQHMHRITRIQDKSKWIRVPHTHEAIIDQETWRKVQLIKNGRNKDIGLKDNNSIFAGYLVCGDCGRAMMKNAWTRADGSKTFSFYCGTYKRVGKKYCTPHTLPLTVLEEIVLQDLNKIIHRIENLSSLVHSRANANDTAKNVVDAEIRRTTQELEKVSKLKISIYEDYKEGIITKEEFISYKANYSQKEDLYRKQLAALQEKQSDNVIDKILSSPWVERLVSRRSIDKLDRLIVVEMIDHIEVYENKKIKIFYNFSNDLKILFSD